MITPSAMRVEIRSQSPGVTFFDSHDSSLNIAISAQLSIVYSAGFEKRSSCCMDVDEFLEFSQMFCFYAQVIGSTGIRDFVFLECLDNQTAECCPILLDRRAQRKAPRSFSDGCEFLFPCLCLGVV